MHWQLDVVCWPNMENVLAKMGITGKNMGNGLFAENHDLLENTYKHMIFIGKIIVFIWQKLGISYIGQKQNHKKDNNKIHDKFLGYRSDDYPRENKKHGFRRRGSPNFSFAKWRSDHTWLCSSYPLVI